MARARVQVQRSIGMSVSKKWKLVGFGFNGFDQLNESSMDGGSDTTNVAQSAPHTDLSVTSPRLLMELDRQPSAVVISSSWDALNIYVSDGEHSRSVSTGRWSGSVPEAVKTLQEEERVVREVVETIHGHMILHTAGRRLLVALRGADGSVEVGECTPPPSQQVTKMRCLNNGRIYALLESGSVLECFLDSPTSYRLRIGCELPTGGYRISDMACGADHCLLLTDGGAVLSCGLGTRGQLGHGDIQPRTEPSLIHALSGLPMKDIACGHWHCLVLSASGDVYSWGWNEHGQLGLRSPPGPTVALPTLVDIITDSSSGCDLNFVSVSCGSRHSAAVSENDVLYSWGWDAYGQIYRDQWIGTSLSVYCANWCTVCSLTETYLRDPPTSGRPGIIHVYINGRGQAREKYHTLILGQ